MLKVLTQNAITIGLQVLIFLIGIAVAYLLVTFSSRFTKQLGYYLRRAIGIALFANCMCMFVVNRLDTWLLSCSIIAVTGSMILDYLAAAKAPASAAEEPPAGE